MRWHNQIEACTNAANISEALKESEKEAKIVISDPGAQAIANNALYESKSLGY